MPTSATKRGSSGVSAPSTADMASSKIETTVVDPKELDKMKKSVLGPEQAPALSEMTPDQNTWSQFRDTLGPPFDSERVTMTQCRQIRKDPMVAFGLHYLKVPLARAEWHIDAYDNNGPNPQVAAFVDACLRKIYARFILQRSLAKDFGYQGMSKRFIWENPGGFYTDPKATDPEKALKPAWDEGEVLPIIWKQPVALRPETTLPTFDEKTGEFTGISYTAPQGVGRRKSTGGKSGGAQGVQQYDIYHAYWVANMKDDEHGSMYGYPLTGFARDYWWAYRFLFMMSNRAYERLAIPPILAYHPEGSTLVDTETQEMRPNWEIALEAAERLRTNAVAAVPSTMATAGLDASATQREWDFKFMETPYEALSVFNERFNYLNVMKLRSVWVPELAFIGNGVGGNSAGNIAEQMAAMLVESQALEMDECDEDINRLWIPQLLTLNFPDFINNGGVAKKISHGFRKEDVDFYKQIIQLIGQTNPELLAQVDLVEVLRRIGTPIKSPDALEAERRRIATQQAAGQAPAVTPQRGGLGIVRNPGANAGVTGGGSSPITANANGNSSLGFDEEPGVMSYVYGGETYSVAAQFADGDTDEFLANLPTSKHYQDRAIRSFMLQLRRLWLGYYRNLFPEFAAHVGQTKLELSDLVLEGTEVHDGPLLALMFANGDSRQDKARRVTAKAADKMARQLLRTWGQSSEKLAELRDRSKTLLRKVLDRQHALDKRATNLKVEDWDAKADDIEDFLNNQVGRLIRLTHSTIRDELRAFLVANIREGKTSAEIADEIRAHFSGFEGAKADRVARSEVRDTVNAATLLTGEAIGLRYTRASDGNQFDSECADRDGKLLTIREAWREMRKEHPYGTLGFDLIPRLAFSVETVQVLPDGAGDDPETTAWFDSDTDTAYMLLDQPQEDKDEFLYCVADLVMS